MPSQYSLLSLLQNGCKMFAVTNGNKEVIFTGNHDECVGFMTDLVTTKKQLPEIDFDLYSAESFGNGFVELKILASYVLPEPCDNIIHVEQWRRKLKP